MGKDRLEHLQGQPEDAGEAGRGEDRDRQDDPGVFGGDMGTQDQDHADKHDER